MSDFHQFGPVTAIPRLVSRDPEEMERRIEELARRFPVALRHPDDPGGDGSAGPRADPRRAVRRHLGRHAGDLPEPGEPRGLPPGPGVLRALPRAPPDPVERVPGGGVVRVRHGGRGALHRRARQGSGLLAGHRARPRRGAGRLHRVPGRRRRELHALDAGAPGSPGDRADRRLRLRQGLLRAGLRPSPRTGDPAAPDPAPRRLHPPHRAGPVHRLPLLVPLRALRGVHDQARPRREDAPALRLGPGDRDAVRGAAPPRPRAAVPGGDRGAVRPQAPGPLRAGPDPGAQPDGPRRHQAPPAHPGRGRGQPLAGAADEPAGRLPAPRRGRGHATPTRCRWSTT